MEKLKSLWRGDLRLGDAFWNWAVVVGVVVNVTTSALFLTFVAADQIWLALLFGYGCSVPYNIVAACGVWRSAARYDGPALHADLARVAIVVLMTALSLT